MLVVWSCVVNWVVVVVVIGVVDRAGCSTLQSIPFRAVFRRSERGQVTRYIVVFSVGYV